MCACRRPPGERSTMAPSEPQPIIGASVTRLEDDPLVRGRGLFAADVSFPYQLHMRVVRSSVAHARIGAVEIGKALPMPGIAAVWTGRDLADIAPIDFRDD